jgi:long-chain acyl-CoA synthetase
MLVGGDLMERWAAAVPDVPMVLGYGLTEASPEVCNNPLGAPRAGTVGVPLPGTRLRLRDPAAPSSDDRREGELQVAGPQITCGYWERPEATAEAFTVDGWLRTGDVARFDERGYVVIVDRLKDLIKFRGYSITPAVVEAALRRCPGVRDAVVVGAPDRVDGERPVAFIECDGPPPDADVLRAFAAGRLAPHEVPRSFVAVDEIPRNHVGKPLRRVLRDSVQSLPD